MKSEIIFGVHPVREAIKAARREVMEINITSGRKNQRLADIEQLAVNAGIRVNQMPPDKLSAVSASQKHQGVAARVSPLPLYDLQDFMAFPGNGKDPLILVLDQVLDPHNLGAIIRTALCAGVDGILCPRDRAAAPTPVVSRISAGAMEHVRLARVTNLVSAIQVLKAKSFWVAGMDMAGERSVFEADFSGPLALIIGGEEKGLRPLVKKHCDFLVSIPQANTLNSLNASVAAAIVLYAAFGQRRLTQESLE